MMSIIVGLVAACKTFNKLSQYVDMFIVEWVKYDIDQIGGTAQAMKEENEVLNAKFKEAKTDKEQRVLLRILADRGSEV